MELNYLGLAAGLSGFLSIWLGHIAVRKIEAHASALWLPAGGALILGLVVEAVSVKSENLYVTAVCGILGVTLFWDALELFRQQKRVKQGHAPANPNNPRHAHILAGYPAASTLDWLARHPRGQKYSAEELAAMKASAK